MRQKGEFSIWKKVAVLNNSENNIDTHEARTS